MNFTELSGNGLELSLDSGISLYPGMIEDLV